MPICCPPDIRNIIVLCFHITVKGSNMIAIPRFLKFIYNVTYCFNGADRCIVIEPNFQHLRGMGTYIARAWWEYIFGNVCTCVLTCPNINSINSVFKARSFLIWLFHFLRVYICEETWSPRFIQVLKNLKLSKPSCFTD